VERGMYAFACLLLFIMAVVMSYYASRAGWDREMNKVGRAINAGIQPSWIAASVFSWLLFVIYLADLVAQCALGYPTVRHVNS